MPKIWSFSENSEEGWNFIKSFKLQSSNQEKQSAIAAFAIAIGSLALDWYNDV